MVEPFRNPERKVYVHKGYSFVSYHPENGCRKIRKYGPRPSYVFGVDSTDITAALQEAKVRAANKKCGICGSSFTEDLTQTGRIVEWVNQTS